MLSRDDIQLGKIVVDAEFVTPQQVEECIRIQKEGSDARPIGAILVEKGYLTSPELEELLEIQQEYMQQLSDRLEASAHRPVGSPPTLAQELKRARELPEETPVPVIAGYKIQRVLGRGTMGIVYRATQLSMERQVAIKVLSPRYAKNETFVKRFMVEARASAKLNHPNIVQGLDVGESGGLYYFIMEYLDGRRIGDLLRRGGALDEKRVTHIVTQIARALEHAHRFNIVHRDIKPDNIMLTHDGTAKLCDLGLVRWVAGDRELFASEGRVGTPHYMSPEQVRSDVEVDTRSDIYSLGASFYHMVVGHVPFDGRTVEEVLRHHVETPLIPPGLRNPHVSQKVEYIIQKMMAKRPEERYQTPQHLVKDLVLVSVGGAPVGMAVVQKADSQMEIPVVRPLATPAPGGAEATAGATTAAPKAVRRPRETTRLGKLRMTQKRRGR